LIPVMSLLRGRYEGQSPSVVLKETAGIWILTGVALFFIWSEFKTGARLLTLFDIIKVNPFGIFVKNDLGDGTVHLLNILFHSAGWFILLIPLIAIVIYRP
jgi:hypothetical protein